MPQLGIAPGEWDFMQRAGMGLPGMGQPQTGGLGQILFGGGNPQNQALLTLGLGMLAARDKGMGFGEGAFNAYQTAANDYRGAQDQAFRNTLVKRQEERAEAQAKRVDEQAKREQQASDTENRQRYAITAGRISTGLSGAKDQAAYWKIVQGLPEVQATLQSYGIDPTQVTPETLPQIQQQLATAGQVGGPVTPKTPLQLKAIVGPNGKPILVPEELAVGQAPWEKPSKGISMTMPDGTVVEIGGDGSKVGPGELSKPTINNLQETIVNSTSRLDRLNATLATYNPQFLQARGIVKANTTKLKDFLSMDVSPEQRKYLDEYSQFQSSAATDLAQFLKEMSGAAVTPQEYARTEKALPSGTELSPTEFEAKSKVAVKTISRAIMRANWALKNGIGVTSVEQLAKAMPLEGIDAVFEKRANEIWQQMGGTPEVKAQAMQQAKQEFGLAR